MGITTRIRKIVAAATLTVVLGSAMVAGAPSQWGSEHVAKKGSFDSTESEGQRVAKVNEYEGQHRVAATGEHFSKAVLT